MLPIEGLYCTVSPCETVNWGFPSNWAWEQVHTKGVSENQLPFWMPGYNLWGMQNIRKEIKSEDGRSEKF